MFVVLMETSAWGPFDAWEDASQFCAFVTAEVDPAVIVPVRSPVAELLAWRDTVMAEVSNASTESRATPDRS